MAERQDFAPVLSPSGSIPLMFTAAQIRHELGEHRGETVEVFVAVMEVVDDPDVGYSLTP